MSWLIKSPHPDIIKDKGLSFSSLFLVAAKVVGEKSVRIVFAMVNQMLNVAVSSEQN